MYNGVGLSTVRGTATSGHVQRNASHVQAQRHRRRVAHNQNRDDGRNRKPFLSAAAQLQGNRELQSHQRKRQLENKLLELREEMEEEGMVDEDIEQRINTERQRMWDEWQQQQENDMAKETAVDANENDGNEAANAAAFTGEEQQQQPPEEFFQQHWLAFE